MGWVACDCNGDASYPMNAQMAIDVSGVWHRYRDRVAIENVSLSIASGEVFALLGPNGGGKTTLFRLLSTLLAVQEGEIRIFGHELSRDPTAVRQLIGVVFQAASLDKKLTVRENLVHQGRLYGLDTATIRARQAELLDRLDLAERAGDLVETLSGGLRRRVELAKGMIHRPRLLLMDEPSTGLDPGARSVLWDHLMQLRDDDGVTVLLTTHLLEEADKADRIGILDQGHLVALDTPEALKDTLGGDSITIETADPSALAEEISARLDQPAQVIDGRVRIERPDGHQWIARIVEEFPGRIDSITLGKPTLEDVFIARTGHAFEAEALAEASA